MRYTTILIVLTLLSMAAPARAETIPDDMRGAWLLIQEGEINQTITINGDGTTSGTYRDLASNEQRGGVWIGRVERQCEIRRDLCAWYWTNGAAMLRLDFNGMTMTMRIRGHIQTYTRGTA